MKTILYLVLAAVVASASALVGLNVSGQSPAPRSTRPESFRVDVTRAIVASEPGCNATAFAQLPREPSLFIGRQFVGADGRLAGVSGANDCSGGDPNNEAVGKPFNRWGLVLNSFDWATKSFHIIKPLLDTSLDPRTRRSRAAITGGAMRGLLIRSAYDPSVVEFRGTIFIAFECTSENGELYGVQQTSSCMAVYNPRTKSIDMSRAVVVVTGEKRGDTYQVAALPRLLSYGGKLYLYWSAMHVREGKIIRSVERGGELDVTGSIPVLFGAENRVAKAFDLVSTEVWAPDSSSTSNVLVNIMSLMPRGTDFLVLAAVGGESCHSPAGITPGCHRLVIKRSRAPLAHMGFNSAEQVGIGVPTNPHEYALPMVDRQGAWWILGHFIRPTKNGFAERVPAPSSQFWATTARPSTLALLPVTFTD